jgi:hypothetical protein
MIIHGKVSERVASVEVRPLDGGAVATEIIPDPAGFGVSFFVQFVPRDTLGEVVALDAAGNVLQRVRLRPLESGEPPPCCQEEVLDQHKVTIYYPLDWFRAEEPLVSGVEGTQEIVSVGTFAMAAGVEGCVDLPGRALQSMGPGDALVTLHEVLVDLEFGPAPGTSRPSRAAGPTPSIASRAQSVCP